MTAERRPFRVTGTATIVRFNWPKFVVAFAILGAAIAASNLAWPSPVRAALWLVGGAGACWSVTSLLATWWVYDHRRVYDQVGAGLAPIGAWASVHAGFDDATPELIDAIGHRPAAVVELATPARPSLRRARSLAGGDGVPPSRPGALPIGSGALDAVFVTLAAHEVRDLVDQRALFTELDRVLAPGGRVVVTEHLRDRANAAVYGPAAFHFQPGRTWIDRADEAGLELLEDGPITPFVHRMIWRREPAAVSTGG